MRGRGGLISPDEIYIFTLLVYRQNIGHASNMYFFILAARVYSTAGAQRRSSLTRRRRD
jgi:hypothetical protein